jgi:ABC-2 type transport system ATP-binding protein
MFMRLGFSVAIHTEPQVLLVDEVLAVGDSAFQMKCLERMRHIQQSGTTIVLVSHSMHAVRLLCPRTVLMRRGALEFDGDTELAIARHHELLSKDAASESHAPAGEHVQRVTGGAEIVELAVVDDGGAVVHYTSPDEPLRVRLRVRFEQQVDNPLFAFTLLAEDGSVAYGLQSPVSLSHTSFAAGDVAEVELGFEPRLGGGSYRATTTVASSDGRMVLAADPVGALFYVEPRDWAFGAADLKGAISVDGRPLIEDRAFRLDA